MVMYTDETHSTEAACWYYCFKVVFFLLHVARVVLDKVLDDTKCYSCGILLVACVWKSVMTPSLAQVMVIFPSCSSQSYDFLRSAAPSASTIRARLSASLHDSLLAPYHCLRRTSSCSQHYFEPGSVFAYITSIPISSSTSSPAQ